MLPFEIFASLRDSSSESSLEFFSALCEFGIGPTPTFRHVCFSAACGGEADIERFSVWTDHIAFDPERRKSMSALMSATGVRADLICSA